MSSAQRTPPAPDDRDLDRFRALLKSYMAKKGLKSTDQRRLILETFLHAARHVSVEDVRAGARAVDSRVGYATVYRTLKLLAECGVAIERRFVDGVTRYELADGDAHHDHLICLECGDIAEFSEPRIEMLQAEVARIHGFELRMHKHEMYGRCAQCAKQGAGT
jgi:Fur family ferric uptake transcriptional regulator